MSVAQRFGYKWDSPGSLGAIGLLQKLVLLEAGPVQNVINDA